MDPLLCYCTVPELPSSRQAWVSSAADTGKVTAGSTEEELGETEGGPRRGGVYAGVGSSPDLDGAVFGWPRYGDRGAEPPETVKLQSAVPPPSTTRVAPVMNEESSVARKSAALAISSGLPIRPSGRSSTPFR